MFRDRQHAGELLAVQLASYRDRPRTLLLALPRGGVPVAAAMAQALALPLDLFAVHKLGAPSQPEFAIGAITACGLVVVNQDAIDSMHISQAELDSVIARERDELLRRERAYRGDQPVLDAAGQTIILVDDGLATGYTMLAAIRAIRRQQPARIVVAVPVASSEALDLLRHEADELCCVYTPDRLVAVGQFYRNFFQITDNEVLEAMRQLEPTEASRLREAAPRIP